MARTKRRIIITENDIKRILGVAKNISHAAEMLGVTKRKLARHALLYKDEEGRTYYELLTALKGRNHQARAMNAHGRQFLLDMLNGDQHAPYKNNPDYLKQSLVYHGLVEDKCMWPGCNFCERRSLDYKTPIVLTFKDGNTRNGTRENIYFLCFNHYFISKTSVPPKPGETAEKLTRKSPVLPPNKKGQVQLAVVPDDFSVEDIDRELLESMRELGILDEE